MEKEGDGEVREVAIVVLLCLVAAAADAQVTPQKLDADCEKVLVISDFETEAEIANHKSRGAAYRFRPKRENRHTIWLGVENAKWSASRLEISDEHVYHGKRSLKAHASVGSGHAWTFATGNSFPQDWTGYDAVRFFIHWPKHEKPAQFIWGYKLQFTNAEGKRDQLLAWFLYKVKPGDSSLEIPLSAIRNLKWPGPKGGYGSGVNMTGMSLWNQDRKHAYLNKVGWPFDKVFYLQIGLRGGYSGKVPHHYWVDYVRLVKWKKKKKEETK